MQIRRKRIRNPQRYLYELSEGESFYLAVPVKSEDLKSLRRYGLEEGTTKIPIPRKPVTEANANGKWIPLKHLPKE